MNFYGKLIKLKQKIERIGKSKKDDETIIETLMDDTFVSCNTKDDQESVSNLTTNDSTSSSTSIHLATKVIFS